MGGEDGRQTNRTVRIQHEHALSVNNIDQGILKDKGGRREGVGGRGQTNDICECFYSRQLIPCEYRNQQMSSLIFTAHIYHITHVHNSLWRRNSGGQTRLHSCLVLAVNPINNIRIFWGDKPDCIVGRSSPEQCKGNFLGHPRLHDCLASIL